MVNNNISINILVVKLKLLNIIKYKYNSKKELIKMSKMVLENKDKLIKEYPEVNKRYFTTCPQQFLDNISKVDKNYIYITYFS